MACIALQCIQKCMIFQENYIEKERILIMQYLFMQPDDINLL